MRLCKDVIRGVGYNSLMIKISWVTALFLWVGLWAGQAAAREMSVSEEILEILREKDQISEEQYQQMKARAAEEKVQKQGSETDFKVYWKNGLRLESNDGNFKYRIGGRIQLDWGSIDPDGDLNRDLEAVEGDPLKGSGVEFRRARLFISGTLYDSVIFKAEYDFAQGETEFKSVYLGLKKVPYIGRILVGHIKEPFSLEELTSSKYITFMERALPNAFVPGYNTGILLQNAVLNERLTWAAGVFQEADDFGDSFNDFSDYNITARLTGLPWYVDDGTRLIHLGLSYSHQVRDEKQIDASVRYRSRPETHLTDARIVDTSDILVDDVNLINPELALVYGPFSLQGEYFQALLAADAADDPDFRAYYVYGSFFLTGEHRAYDPSDGSFDRVVPKQNFHPTQGGWGAWELGLRYSTLDLTEENVAGGKAVDWTVGLNWYLNPQVRVMFNYVHSNLKDRANVTDGDVNIFQSRFQIDF
jgi:phosphate-selective porin OprO/OprP